MGRPTLPPSNLHFDHRHEAAVDHALAIERSKAEQYERAFRALDMLDKALGKVRSKAGREPQVTGSCDWYGVKAIDERRSRARSDMSSADG